MLHEGSISLFMVAAMVIVAVALIGIDQGLKIWAVDNLLSESGEFLSKEFIKFGDTEILALTYRENTGAAFSMFEENKIILLVLPMLLMIACVWVLWKYGKQSKFISWCVILILSGGIGNLIDRIRLGYVVDYLEIKLFDFAIFNFADCCITVSEILFIIYILFINKTIFRDKSKKELAAEQGAD